MHLERFDQPCFSVAEYTCAPNDVMSGTGFLVCMKVRAHKQARTGKSSAPAYCFRYEGTPSFCSPSCPPPPTLASRSSQKLVTSLLGTTYRAGVGTVVRYTCQKGHADKTKKGGAFSICLANRSWAFIESLPCIVPDTSKYPNSTMKNGSLAVRQAD